ncbi:cell wall metabolism sensor histidine kinase WalK [Aquibacillus sp. 3ASR75-11]|uniref:histidine kinase n=1 Tax=Terrihalobacillus insolitus TaxID=2950438 RepID=A0A9X3WZ59_9BACI|nr:cell wall metabolism sensor histidine kinase WalK [Terrihalobacillus insolitus]MDC3425974.1 cell wall metabolism sensor histidine kinase WalK [Terrihalobacillus insolitus]
MRKVRFFQSIRLKIILIYILLILIAIQVIGAYFAQELEKELRDNFVQSIDDRVQLLTYQLEQTFALDRDEEKGSTLAQDVQNILSYFDDISDIQVIDNQNRVLGTNNFSDDSKIGKRITAESRVTRVFKFGQTSKNFLLDPYTGRRMYVRTVPIYKDNDVVGAVYLQASMEGVFTQLEQINQIFANGTLIAISISALIGVLIARTITKPITEMRKQAQIMSTGDFSQKVNVYGTDEIGQLAVTFNEMNDKLRQAHATTEGERRKLSSILSHMSDGVIATDETGAITLMNNPAVDLIRKSFEDVKGKQLIDVLHLHERDIDLTELQETGSIIIDFSEDDAFFLIRANFSIILGENEKTTGFITVISDVTEQEKVERERKEFVSNVSHELRTPLTTMRSYLEALSDGAWKDNEIAPKFLEVTQNETERMIRLVNDLLQLSKMDNKDYTLYKERVNFISYFHHIIDRFEMNKPEDIVLDRQLPKNDVFVWLDKDKMTQVLDNIISNAMKYSPEGGTITFHLKKEKQKLLISVSDEGMGISHEKLDKVFDRFYRADKARSRKLGGTGLGLAIAKELVEAHEGKIWAKSKEGKGTTILFTLPLIQKKRRGVS